MAYVIPAFLFSNSRYQPVKSTPRFIRLTTTDQLQATTDSTVAGEGGVAVPMKIAHDDDDAPV